MIGQLLRRSKMPLMKRAVIAAGLASSSQRVSLAAAGCAFYATLALFPAITMLISLYGLAYDPDTVQPQLHYLRHFMPPAAYSLISGRIQNLVSQPVQGLGISFLVSLALSLWSSSSSTQSVLHALSLAYGQVESRSFIRFQLVALGMTVIAIIGTALAIGVLVLIPIVIARVGLSGNAQVLVTLLSFAVMIVFVIGALGLLYRFGPAGTGRIFYAPGASLATFIWLLASWAFGLYVGHFAAYSATYGPLSTLIGLMMWFYLTAYAVLFGAEMNAALDEEWRRQAD
jgi:membrane protein